MLRAGAVPKEGSGELRALIVSYSFPPTGGAGVQRATKLCKYLPEYGVRPAVLTVRNASVPVTDPSLARDLPPWLEVVRARTFEPGYGVKRAAWSAGASPRPTLRSRMTRAATAVAKQVLVPDPQVLWLPGAGAALARRLLRGDDDVLVVTGPPFSPFLLAWLAALRPRVGVVFDYRDEWSTYRTAYEMTGSRLATLAGEGLEAALLRRADAVTTATDEFRDNLLERFRFLDPGRVVAVPNGYDRGDFAADPPAPPADRMVVTYAGTVFKLTSARGLIGALRKLHEREPELARRLEVRFLGRVVDTERDAFEGASALGVRELGYVPHERVLGELAASHLVLCLLDDVPGVERIYPAKIFELMYLGRPILTLAPPGALARLVASHGLGDVLPPRDEEAICALLAAKLRAFVALSPAERQHPPAPAVRGIARYDRRALAGEFASVLRAARARAARDGRVAPNESW